ncbi:MAG: hypothetical protein Q7J69_03585 [Candidatus Omnitrophota bacterium]|nr:hypothetical protein [Candidatus Omnitrophota bacterium]
MKLKRSCRGGFSLVEVLVVSVMAAGMALAISSVIRVGLRSWAAKQGQMDASSELRRSLHTMAKELAQAQRAMDIASTGRLEALVGGAWVAMPADGNFYPTVRFRVPQDLDNNGTVLDAAWVVERSVNPIQYSQGAGANTLDLQRTEGAAVRTLLRGLPQAASLPAGEIPLGFRRLAAPNDSVVEIRVWVQRGAGIPGVPRSGETEPAVLSTQVRLRN